MRFFLGAKNRKSPKRAIIQSTHVHIPPCRGWRPRHPVFRCVPFCREAGCLPYEMTNVFPVISSVAEKSMQSGRSKPLPYKKSTAGCMSSRIGVHIITHWRAYHHGLPCISSRVRVYIINASHCIIHSCQPLQTSTHAV